MGPSLPGKHLILLLLVAFSVAGTQRSLAVPVPNDPRDIVARPETRRRISAEPAAIAQRILSASEEIRRLGFRQLGVKPESLRSRTAEVDEVRLFATNLDSDSDLEFVLVYATEPDTTALVFDRNESGWWQVGAFSSQGHSGDRLIELKPAVDSTRNDIIVRVRSTGTGFVRSELAIYRLTAGHLYRVFRTVEAEDYDTSGPGKAGAWYFERKRLIFPVSNEAGQHFLIVHHTKATDPATTAAGRTTPRRPQSLSCSVYRWDRDTFSFRLDQTAQPTYCDSREPRSNIVSDWSL